MIISNESFSDLFPLSTYTMFFDVVTLHAAEYDCPPVVKGTFLRYG